MIADSIDMASPNIDTGRTAGSSGNSLEYFYPRDFTRFVKQASVFARQSDFIFSDWYFSLTPKNCNFRPIGDEPAYVRKKHIPLPESFNPDNQSYFEKLQEFFQDNSHIHFLHGDPKHLLFIIIGFERFHLSLAALDAIFLTYSYTNKQLLRYFKETFKTKVFDNYGCSEIGPIA